MFRHKLFGQLCDSFRRHRLVVGDRSLAGVLGDFGQCWSDGRGGLHGLDLFLLLGLLGSAELVFHLEAELVGGTAKLGHQLAQLTGELGQLLWPKEQKGQKYDDGAVLKARHKYFP